MSPRCYDFVHVCPVTGDGTRSVDVNFSKRLSRVAAVATWGSLLLSLAGAWALAHFKSNHINIDLSAFYIWTAVGVVMALALSALPALHKHSEHIQQYVAVYRFILI